ncbi:hypothetical protein GCM10020216_030870 [Nonomuraea helvata]
MSAGRAALLTGAADGIGQAVMDSLRSAERRPGTVRQAAPAVPGRDLPRTARRLAVAGGRDLDPLDDDVAEGSHRAAGGPVVGACRTYRLFIGGRPAALIGELFAVVCFVRDR